MKKENDRPIPLKERMKMESAVVFYDEDGSVSLDVNQGEITDRKKDRDIDTIEEK